MSDICNIDKKSRNIKRRSTKKLKNNHKSLEKMVLANTDLSRISELFCNLSFNDNRMALNIKKEQEEIEGSALQQHYESSVTTVQHQHHIKPAKACKILYRHINDEYTPLHLTCSSGFDAVVAELIRMDRHPSEYNIQNEEGRTPLHLATLNAQPKIIRMLLIAGAETTIKDHHGNTALHLACKYGEEQCVRALTMPISASEVNEAHTQNGHRANDDSYAKCGELPSDLEISNSDGKRCVHLAAEAGFINILDILLSHGADINAQQRKCGRTPLHCAIERCDKDLLNFLLHARQPLNLEAATNDGLTAYQMAYALGQNEILNILEKHGAEPSLPPYSYYFND